MSLPPAHPPHTKTTTIPLKLIALTGTQPSKGSVPFHLWILHKVRTP